MKLRRKIKHNEKVCCAHDLGSYAQGQGRIQVRGQKVCNAQELGSYAQGQGQNQVRCQIVPKIVLLINYSSKFDEPSQKDKEQ